MGFGATDWVALFIFGISAFVGTFAKRLARIIGLAVMAFAYAGLILSLSSHGDAPAQGRITDNVPRIKTNVASNQGADTGRINVIGPERLVFDTAIGDQLASKLQSGKSVEIMAVGSRHDWDIADQYVHYLKAKGLDVSFSRTSETVPPPDRQVIVRDDPATSPIVVIIAPSVF